MLLMLVLLVLCQSKSSQTWPLSAYRLVHSLKNKEAGPPLKSACTKRRIMVACCFCWRMLRTHIAAHKLPRYAVRLHQTCHVCMEA
jgi:hypothetical protein